jgi:hypothetical protein
MTSDSPPKAHRIFVSYVREDQETVERLAKELSAYGKSSESFNLARSVARDSFNRQIVEVLKR